MKEVNATVNIENLDKLKNLSERLAKECEQVSKTVQEINELQVNIKV